MIDLSGKNAVVCGSTQGIGRACAEVLARQGAQVTLVARDEAALRDVAAGLDTKAGQTHRFVCTDFDDPDAVRESVAAHAGEHGPIHILVNNTGGPKSGPIFEAAADAFVKGFRMHILCNQALAQTLVPGMKEAGYGRIINIISTSVKEPIPGLGVSNTIRGAVSSWSKTLSRELGPFGITVNSVLPGFTDTARLQALFDAKAQRTGKPADEIAADARALIPSGRFARPEEIAVAVAFLASPDASYISGVNLAVDAGRLASM